MNPTRIKMSTTIANRLRRGALIASAIAATFLAHAQQTNAPSRLDYDSFRIISQRNIFNPNRSSRVASARTQERRVRTDNFVLRGTMLYRKGDFAFFDGSNSDLKKVCELSNKIAGYTVKAIENKIARGEWRQGREWKYAPDGRIVIDLEGYKKWVESQPAGVRPRRGPASNSTSGTGTDATAPR